MGCSTASATTRTTLRCSKNLYKLWTRLSSGSYLPPPVQAVRLPQAVAGGSWPGSPSIRSSPPPGSFFAATGLPRAPREPAAPSPPVRARTRTSGLRHHPRGQPAAAYPGPLGERRGRSARTNERRRHRAKRRDVVQDAVDAIADTYRGRQQTILEHQDGAEWLANSTSRDASMTQEGRAAPQPYKSLEPRAVLSCLADDRAGLQLISAAAAKGAKQPSVLANEAVHANPQAPLTENRWLPPMAAVYGHQRPGPRRRPIRALRGSRETKPPSPPTAPPPRRGNGEHTSPAAGATAARGQTRNEHPGSLKEGPCVALGPQP